VLEAALPLRDGTEDIVPFKVAVVDNGADNNSLVEIASPSVDALAALRAAIARRLATAISAAPVSHPVAVPPHTWRSSLASVAKEAGTVVLPQLEARLAALDNPSMMLDSSVAEAHALFAAIDQSRTRLLAFCDRMLFLTHGETGKEK